MCMQTVICILVGLWHWRGSVCIQPCTPFWKVERLKLNIEGNEKKKTIGQRLTILIFFLMSSLYSMLQGNSFTLCPLAVPAPLTIGTCSIASQTNARPCNSTCHDLYGSCSNDIISICPSTEEQAAIVAIGTSWPGLTGTSFGQKWDITAPQTACGPPAAFSGLSCDASGHVVGLEIPGRSLTGPISSGVIDLSYLTSLDLSVNELTGNIPNLDVLVGLTSVSLNNNSLSVCPGATLPPILTSSTCDMSNQGGVIVCSTNCGKALYQNCLIDESTFCPMSPNETAAIKAILEHWNSLQNPNITNPAWNIDHPEHACAFSGFDGIICDDQSHVIALYVLFSFLHIHNCCCCRPRVSGDPRN
jgi:hypothetical protein